jgi:ribosomal protein L11 methyltransferase
MVQPDEPWAVDAVTPATQYAVTGYFPHNRHFKSAISNLQERLKNLERLNEVRTHLLSRIIDEQDWAESWKAFFNPVQVTDSIVIKPTWKALHGSVPDIVIEIDPGMAFGTGTHPTTVMCIRMLQYYLKPQESVLDVGTGSGILMIAAAKLGAGILVGVDNDHVATRVADTNLAINRISAGSYLLVQGHLVEAIGHQFDIVIANLLTGIIVDLLDGIRRVIRSNGIFICSGIYAGHLGQVRDALHAHNLKSIETLEQEEWVCLAVKDAGA